MRARGRTQKEIADTIGRDKSVVSRELRRNGSPKTGKYTYDAACKRCEARKARLSRRRRFTERMEKAVRKYLLMDWSPEQIVGYRRRMGLPMVSVERIYQYIREDRRDGGTLYRHCRHRLKRRARPVGTASRIRNRKGIELRPAESDGTRLGDLEMDLMVGRNNQDAVLTMVDRLTGYTWIRALPDGKDARGVANACMDIIAPIRKHVRTITTDNGPEFAAHEMITRKTGVDIYFAHPYSSWEKGLIEYTNKLYRQYLVKGSSLKRFSQKDLNRIQRKLNSRPRKKLGFLTPSQVFSLYLRQTRKVAFVT